MNFGSLFSGIGNFDLAFERAGMKSLWQCEIDAACRSVLASHWPSARRYTNVIGINYRNGKAWRRYWKPEPVDLICGGFPCQDVSVAGNRAGLAGERSGLWFEFRRILEQSRPQWVVIENVPGLLSSNAGRDFAVILRGLVELGYGVAWRILDSQYFGVAQRRRRVFIVGSLGDGRAAEVLFERESGLGDTAPRRETGERAAPTIAGGFSGAGGGNRYGMNVETADSCVVGSLTAHHGRNNPDSQPFVFDLAQITSNVNRTRVGPELPASTLNQAGQMHVAHTLRAEGHDASEDGTGRGVPMVTGFMPRRTNVGALAEQVPTQNTGQGGMGAPGDAGSFGVRRLMPIECERLQGNPDGWTDGQSDSARYRQLGNAVTVNTVEWLGRRIMAVTT